MVCMCLMYKIKVHTSSGMAIRDHKAPLWKLLVWSEAAGMALFQAVPQKYSRLFSPVLLSSLQEPL